MSLVDHNKMSSGRRKSNKLHSTNSVEALLSGEIVTPSKSKGDELYNYLLYVTTGIKRGNTIRMSEKVKSGHQTSGDERKEESGLK